MPDTNDVIAILKQKAEESYRDFLRNMDAIDEERKQLFSDTLKEVDQARIDEVKRRLAQKFKDS